MTLLVARRHFVGRAGEPCYISIAVSDRHRHPHKTFRDQFGHAVPLGTAASYPKG